MTHTASDTALPYAPDAPQDPADLEQIRRTLARYCHLVDQGRFDELATVFAEDAVMEVPGETISGRADILASIEGRQPADQRGQHVTVNEVIDVAGDEAEVTSNFVFFARTRHGFLPLLIGRYEDVLRREGPGWQFTRRRVFLAESKK